MPSFKVSRLTRGRLLAAVAAASVIGSVVVAAAPAFAQEASCTSHTTNWAKLYPNVSDWANRSSATDCIGFVSDNNFPRPNYTKVFCAGNNSGVLTYLDLTTGTTDTHSFWPTGSYYVLGGTYSQIGPAGPPASPDVITVIQVQITGYSGSAPC